MRKHWQASSEWNEMDPYREGGILHGSETSLRMFQTSRRSPEEVGRLRWVSMCVRSATALKAVLALFGPIF